MKKRILFFGVLGLSCALTFGCADQEKKQEEAATTEESNEQENKQAEEKKVNIFYEDENGEVQQTEVAVQEPDAEKLWDELIKMNKSLEGTKLISCVVDDDKKSIILDLDKKFGDAVRGMGSTGEVNIIQCVVDTFADFYKCNEVLLTEEGQTFCSNSKEYGEYIRKKSE